MLPGRGCHQYISDLFWIVAVLTVEPHNKVKLLLFLLHLSRYVPANGCLDQGVDVSDIQSVPGDLGAVDLDGETGLPELLHQRYIANPAHPLQNLFDGFAFLLQRIQI